MNQSCRSLTWLLTLLIILRTPASSQSYHPAIDVNHYDFTLKVNDDNDMLSGQAAKGLAILMVSSDLPEVLGMADRVLVMREGRLVAELMRTEATQERVMSAAAGAVA